MPRYLLMTQNGATPPKYTHQSIESATQEAKRLADLHKCPVHILMVVGIVSEIEVPVFRKELKVTMLESTPDDDLPF